MVVVTHDHVDHCQDLGTLVILFRQFNKWLVDKNNEPPHVWDMIVSYGVADQFVSLLNHPDNAPFVLWRKILADHRQKIDGSRDVPGFLKDAAKNGLLSGDPYLHAFFQRAATPLLERYTYEIEMLPAKHKELLWRINCIRVEVYPEAKDKQHASSEGSMYDHHLRRHGYSRHGGNGT